MADMPTEEFRRSGHEVIDWIADYLRDIRDLPVLPRVQPGVIRDVLTGLGARKPGEPIETILRDFRDIIVPANTHWNHPSFHAYFSVSASGPGILAEALTAALNVNHMVWKSSPAGSELELVTLDWLRQWLELAADFFGMIFDTASISTMHALIAARDFVDPDCRDTRVARRSDRIHVRAGAFLGRKGRHRDRPRSEQCSEDPGRRRVPHATRSTSAGDAIRCRRRQEALLRCAHGRHDLYHEHRSGCRNRKHRK